MAGNSLAFGRLHVIDVSDIAHPREVAWYEPTDGGVHNVRAFDNRCANSTGGAFSTQPIFGGPAYIFRNVAYNSTTGGALNRGNEDWRNT